MQYIKKRRLEKNKYSSPKISKQSNKFDQIFSVNNNMSYDKTITGVDTINFTKKTDFLPIYDVKGTSTSLLSTNNEEMKIRETFKNVWKSSSTNNGGYCIKLHYVNVPTVSQYYPVIVDVSNNSGQHQIYIKARTFAEVLQKFGYHVNNTFPELSTSLNLPFFMDIIVNVQFVELRDTPYGPNKYKATKKDEREYKYYIMLFFIPRNRGEQQEVLEKFKNFLHHVFSSNHFFILMDHYTMTLSYEGGQIGKHLRNKESDAWKI
jgi:hypothetical protein